ncbi:Methyl-accepting chemotaxis protein I (serine chemoreceptor protein) [Collimonas arenae]|uniref:Methyl-accepting chemotaxis protein I (Serine chemoreceptor protein) n=1 Tax=Collimonas arenae TaxID=279058 RepID=A0A0A1FA80_9BURK|nr:methyl-accepting chemotaxis protein [Collimonas arenae]AIY41436.1 Methyl-accepting chemotaxis protein I (serine chemoreceptor protein) [Collimonas arenae]
MKQWTIRQRMLVSFGVILLLMGFMAGISYLKLQAIEHETNSFQADSMPGLELSTAIRSTWFQSYLLVLQLVTVDIQPEQHKQDLATLLSDREKMDQLMADYDKTIFQDQDRSNFNGFKAARIQYERLTSEVLKLDEAQKNPQARSLLIEQLQPAWQQGRAAATQLRDFNQQSEVHSVDKIVAAVIVAKSTLLTALAIALIVSLICGFFLLRAITRPMEALVAALEVIRSGDLSQRLNLNRHDEFQALEVGLNRMSDELTGLVGQAQKSAIQVTTSVVEIAATAKQQQATANETAATTTEIGATSREIYSTSRELVSTMNEVSSGAEEAARLGGAGQAGLTQMEDTMHHVMDAAGSVNAKLAILNEKASNINQVVTTITKVAGQTNLLSLNAAIEAEKAGEYGRGFSVVAIEIRRLADQTAVATYDIEQMVKEIQSAVSAGVMGMDKFSEEVRRGIADVQNVGAQLSQIILQVQALTPRFQSVHEGVQAQAVGAEQISQALGQLSEAAQQSVESLRQSSQAIDELTLTANGLRNGVSRFKLKTS